jgi:hypothetical protein
MSMKGAPSPRTLHQAVWTGSETLIWGGQTAPFPAVFAGLYFGYGSGTGVSGGGGYDPTTDTWTPLPNSALSGLSRGIAAAWTGTDLLIPNSQYLQAGSELNLATGRWTTLAEAGARSVSREYETAVWTGNLLLVWGGQTSAKYAPEQGGGAASDPRSGVWAALPTPPSTTNGTAVWNGSQLYVWGGGPISTSVKTSAGAYYTPPAYVATQPPAASRVTHDERYSVETGFRVDDDTIWRFTQQIDNSLAVLGHQVSRTFTLWGCQVQIFQLRVVQACPGVDVASRCTRVELVDELGGAATDVVVQGAHAFVGIGARLVVLDVASAPDPVPVGQSEPLPATIHALRIIESLALVIDRLALRILDLTDLGAPRLIGTYDAAPGVVLLGLAVSGNYAYLAAGSGILVLDFADPTRRTQVGFVPADGYEPALIESDRGYLYLVGNPISRGPSQLHIFSLIDPGRPTEVGKTNVESALAMQVQAGRLYLGGRSISIVDVLDPRQPHVVGSFALGQETSALAIVEGVLVAVEGGTFPGRGDQPAWLPAHLRMLDVSDATRITDLGQVDAHFIGPGAKAEAVDRRLFLTGGSAGGLHVLDVSDAAHPVESGRHAAAGRVDDVDVASDHAYLGNASGRPPRLQILDLADASHSGPQAEYEIPGVDAAVSVSDSTLYVGAGFVGGARILDVTDPAQPIEVGSFHTPGDAYKTVVRDGVAYVADGPTALSIYDVSEPSSVHQVGSYDTPSPKPNSPAAGSGNDVALQDHFAFLAQGWRGLRILDVADPANPIEISSVALQGDARAVAVDGTFAYVILEPGSLAIIDISDPTSAAQIASYDLRGDARSVAVAGNLAYVPSAGRLKLDAGGLQVVSSAGLHVIDVADPAHPVEVAFAPTPAPGTSVRVSVDRVYVAAGEAGLLAFGISRSGGPDGAEPQCP